ncbi:MAG: spermidine synthase, partial [Sciscionella sp.]|nr:spermidine synthase [Sciscionella sp.]
CDGAKGLASTDDGGVDLVVQDAYRAGDPVPDMATVEFLRGQVARVLRPDGLYLANMWGSGDLEFVLRAIAAVGEVFEHLLVFAEAGAFMRKRPGNFVVAASNARLAEHELAEWASNTDNHVHCLNRAQLSAVYGAEIWSNPLIESAPITAPVEPVLRWGHRASTS